MECDYNIYDHEILAIIESMKYWRHYLEGPCQTIQVYIDYQNLETFMTSKTMNCWQACWVKLLANYDFILFSIFRKTNPADSISYRPNYVENIELLSGTLITSKVLYLLWSETLSLRYNILATFQALVLTLDILQIIFVPTSDLHT